MLTKELFVKTINAIQKERVKISEFNDAVGKVTNGFSVITLGSGYLDALLDVLNHIFREESAKYPTIEWWLFQNCEKKIFISPDHYKNNTGKEIEVDVTTPEQLYDYFIFWC